MQFLHLLKTLAFSFLLCECPIISENKSIKCAPAYEDNIETDGVYNGITTAFYRYMNASILIMSTS